MSCYISPRNSMRVHKKNLYDFIHYLGCTYNCYHICIFRIALFPLLLVALISLKPISLLCDQVCKIEHVGTNYTYSHTIEYLALWMRYKWSVSFAKLLINRGINGKNLNSTHMPCFVHKFIWVSTNLWHNLYWFYKIYM